MAAIYSKEVYCDFTSLPGGIVPSTAAGAPAVPAGGDTTTDSFFINGKYFEQYHVAACALLAPTKNAAGLNLGCDATNAEGCELTNGIADNLGECLMKIGTTPAFFLRCIVAVPTVANVEVCQVGFRKAAAYVADANLDTAAKMLTAYEDIATFTLTNGGTLNTATRVGAATATAVASALTPTNGTYYDLRVDISATGATTFRYRAAGAASYTAVVNAATLTSGAIMVPYFRWRNEAAANSAAAILKLWHCGIA